MKQWQLRVGLIGTIAAAGSALLRESEGFAAAPLQTGEAESISGTVSNNQGPEAGVWVVAQTSETPTALIKVVVTDD